VSFIIPRQAVW